MKNKLIIFISLSGLVLITISCSIVKSSLGDLYESLTGSPAPEWAEGTSNQSSFQSYMIGANGLSTINLKEVNKELCPDDHHPHVIAVGGKRWSCCNIGASSPEDIGDVYNLGEMKRRVSIYNMKNDDNWTLPSRYDLESISDHCRFELVKYKGVKGYLLDDRLFLPLNNGNTTLYWSSEYDGGDGFVLKLNSNTDRVDYHEVIHASPSVGAAVRPRL